MVFPGRVDLSEPVQGGVAWGGRLSSEMLLSIFSKESPVHDGAVIISGNRVVRAATILPLSQNRNLPPHFGTRHRAAAGLSEVSDALVIAVSEERSNAVAFKSSEFTELPDQGSLASVLATHFGESAEKRRGGSGMGMEFALAALVSVLLVVGIWFGFTKGMETLTTLEIPVDYVNRSPMVELLEASTNSVELTLAGSRAIMDAMDPDRIDVKLDLADTVPGINTLAVTPEDITLPPGVFLKRVQPATLTITLDIPTKKVLPIQVDWSGKLPGKLILEAATVEPETIEVTGRSADLKRISTLYTEKISLGEIGGPGEISVKLAPIAPSVSDFTGEVVVRWVVRERAE
jgi:YbbR domain-containing protein